MSNSPKESQFTLKNQLKIDSLLKSQTFKPLKKENIRMKNQKIVIPNHRQRQIQLPRLNDKKYTLILDLDQTLIYYNQEGKNGILMERPYLKEFLITASNFFEIIIFTSSEKAYADLILDTVLDFMDKSQYTSIIQHRLYRNHMVENEQGELIKDISLINRNLQNCILIDDNEDLLCQLQKDIFYHIKPYTGNQNDQDLIKLWWVLEDIVNQESILSIPEILNQKDKIIKLKQSNLQQNLQHYPHINFSDLCFNLKGTLETHHKNQTILTNMNNFQIGSLDIQIETPPSATLSFSSNGQSPQVPLNDQTMIFQNISNLIINQSKKPNNLPNVLNHDNPFNNNHNINNNNPNSDISCTQKQDFTPFNNKKSEKSGYFFTQQKLSSENQNIKNNNFLNLNL